MKGRRRATPESRAALKERRASTTDIAPVMDAAATFLAARARSVAETRRRLRDQGYPDDLVETVVERFVELGYLGDDEFARAWVEGRDRARPRGEMALRRELSIKGLSRDVIEAVLNERRAADGEDPNCAAAAALLERRRSNLDREPDPARRRQKAYALLARNGFDPETCREISLAFQAS